jgi:nucleoside-diphosphate-sugar epimerase
MLVAITGGSGFIGSYTVRALRGAGHEVRALVRPTSRRDHIAEFIAEWTEGDVADPQVQAALVAGADAVIHDAADWDALRRSPATNFERNVRASLDLLEAARLAGAGQFLFVSSVAVYATIPPSANGRITEETVTWPSSVYGAYKAAVEPHLTAYHATYGLNTSSWRPAAVYGVDPNLDRSQWLDLIRAAKQGGTIDTAQGGKITHVQDIADALTLALGDEQVAGQLFNLVDGYMYWQRAAEFARELTGSAAAADIIDRKGPGPKNQFDTAKAIAFFDRHGNATALRRGDAGVRAYVAELLPRL